MKSHFFVKLLVVAMLMGFGPSLSAEGNCPPGYYQTGATDFVGCAPLPAQAGDEPADPGPKWASRWGAIATGKGAFGTANNLSSARKAKKAALKQCKENGGQNCKISISFGNQCAALAWSASWIDAAAATDVQQAEAKAIKECSDLTEVCKIYYSACSYPERVR
jgi:Domain of unknown function (DUF4189)